MNSNWVDEALEKATRVVKEWPEWMQRHEVRLADGKATKQDLRFKLVAAEAELAAMQAEAKKTEAYLNCLGRRLNMKLEGSLSAKTAQLLTLISPRK